MGRRGRRPHPDIPTPREWEVLDLIRERLTNEQIAERLGITLDGAKYHVSQILSKLGVETRDDAADWQPERRRWWQRLSALPVAAGIGGVVIVVAAGLEILSGGGLNGDTQEEAMEDSSSGFVDAGDIRALAIGRPVRFEEYGFWLVRLEPKKVVALVDDDTHPRFSADECSVVWREDVLFLGRYGWFRGSCSGSNFDHHGNLVSGPSPLSLYRFKVTLEGSDVIVDVRFPLCSNEFPPEAACLRPALAPEP